MDESQRRKLSAKEFLEKNKQIGFIILTIFISLLIIYFAFVYFYSRNGGNVIENTPITSEEDDSFLGSLLPSFTPTISTETAPVDNDFLSNFGNINRENIDDNEIGDNSKVIKIEAKPIIGYTVFDKPISIKNYIKVVPKICTDKLEPVVKKEEKSTAVLTFQKMVQSMDGYDKMPITGILDLETRDKIYVLQKRYADILYKNKTDKTPTRVIDPQTAHFLNLICGLEKENKDDYVQVPTLRYVLKENRSIVDYNTDSKEKIQVDAKLATGTEDVIFSNDGNLAVFRKDINGTIDSIFYNVRNKGITHLENNISTLDFDSKGVLVYGVPGYQGMTIKKYDYLTNKVSRLATLPLNEWNIYSISETQVGISSKPTAYADGIYMVLDLSTGKLRQLAGPLLGMSVQKTDNPNYSILSTGGNGTTKTLLINTQTRNIGDFGIKTFAEKCSETIFVNGIFCAVPKNLSDAFIYPDDWYKGKVRTEDIILFKSLNGTSTRVVSYLENRPLSIINLNVNKNGIFFMDENTLNLYSLEI